MVPSRFLWRNASKRRNGFLSVAIGLFLVVFVYIMTPIDLSTAHLLIPGDANVLLAPFQPDVVSDFPVTEGVHTIPLIIHQVNRDNNIPKQLVKYVGSVVDNNPEWKYMFWTDAAGRKLIAEKVPKLLPNWDSVKEGIQRGDIIRYIVLYEFGGAYLDLDVEVLRPLDRLTMKYPCIIPPEPFEHNALLYHTEIFLNNAIMFCRPKHPFFKLVIDGLIDADLTKGVLNITGPQMLTRIYEQYIKQVNNSRINISFKSAHEYSPYAVKNSLPSVHPDAIFIPNTQYFTENMDTKVLFSRFLKTCKNFRNESLLRQRACSEISQKGFLRKPNNFTFTVHHYYHSWLKSKVVKFLSRYFSRSSSTDLKEIVGKRIIY